MLPFLTVEKLGRDHTAFLLTSATALWESGMRLLAVWVAICGTFAPALLLAALTGAIGRALRLGRGSRAWRFIAHAVEHWAMPEVHVLAMLVALIKLGDLVEVKIGPGFWCYAAMSVAMLMAWRSFDVENSNPVRLARQSAPA
jgi:paraquat-inducible protein A